MRLARHGAAGVELPLISGADGAWRDLRPVVDDLTPSTLPTVLAGVPIHALPVVPDPERFGPPLRDVGKIVCIGLNYRAHAAETGAQLPKEPILFLKASDTVVGPDDPVLIPRRSVKTDYEVELAVVIGREARYLPDTQAAAACVAGYAISNDISEREFQLERGGQWDKGKNCETFNPFGPWLLSADEVPDPQDLRLRLTVNGEVRQDGTTADMIFGVFELVYYVSQFMVLRPGDVINTGTPAGVAMGLADTPYLRAGDVVSIEIDGLGHQRHTFKEA
ncbi:fumarylacetoacetate hydrolase family protein [Streptomyces sp. NPDC091972]|uniref:fumarylacetoacetate hydrolase family protein n=1 Tax=Streptomyces sp. NPDC091972 TaxID=3366007 RepID=UPI0037F2CCC5